MTARMIPYLLGAFVSLIVALQLAYFLETDRCLDAGYSFEDPIGPCLVPTGGDYQPVFSRPQSYWFWAIFVALVFLPGWIVTRLTGVLIRRSMARSADEPKPRRL